MSGIRPPLIPAASAAILWILALILLTKVHIDMAPSDGS